MCGKCGGSGIIRSYGGIPGRGGRTGPCPKCRVSAAQRFLRDLFEETWGRDYAIVNGAVLVPDSGARNRLKRKVRHER